MIAIENEILVTLAGTTAIVLITVYQIWAMSRAKSKHHRKMLELENSLNHAERVNIKEYSLSCRKEKCSLFCNVSYLFQIIFGVLVFISFTCWAVYLVSVGFIEWAPLPGSLALIGLMTPIIAWRGFKHRRQAMHRLIHDIETSQKTEFKEDKKIVEQPGQPVELKPALVEQEITAKPEPVHEIIKEAAVLPEQQIKIQAKPIRIEKQKLPQDSILRRHFLTHLRSQIESGYPSRPTDSILKRHFDNFIAAEMEKYVDGPMETAFTSKTRTQTTAKPVEPAHTITPASALSEPPSSTYAKAQKQKLPQDSILRRHFLTQLRFQIESGYPPRPTDSILKRHYDNLIATEMATRLEAMEL